MYYGTVTNASVSAGGTINFTTKQNTNELISYANGIISIKAPGYYKVHFDASVNGTGNIIPTLVSDNTVSTTALSTVTGTGNTADLSTGFEALVFVRPALTGYATFYILNNGVAANYVNANLIIERAR